MLTYTPAFLHPCANIGQPARDLARDKRFFATAAGFRWFKQDALQAVHAIGPHGSLLVIQHRRTSWPRHRGCAGERVFPPSVVSVLQPDRSYKKFDAW